MAHKSTPDPEMKQFEKDLLQSIGEMKRGELAAVHTPEQIMARRTRGRPVQERYTQSTGEMLRLNPEPLAR